MKKGFKTTAVAILGMILGLTTFGFWLMGKIDNIGLGVGLAAIASFTSTIGLLLTKDYDQTHTKT